MLDTPTFQKNDSGFICAHCGKKVEPLGYTSRNHCPFCLYSIHIDINPGDRANTCLGLLRPFRAEPHSKKGYVIFHRCEKCGGVSSCRSAHQAKVQPDNIDIIIALTAGEYRDPTEN